MQCCWDGNRLLLWMLYILMYAGAVKPRFARCATLTHILADKYSPSHGTEIHMVLVFVLTCVSNDNSAQPQCMQLTTHDLVALHP